jgi:hypothetical protein
MRHFEPCRCAATLRALPVRDAAIPAGARQVQTRELITELRGKTRSHERSGVPAYGAARCLGAARCRRWAGSVPTLQAARAVREGFSPPYICASRALACPRVPSRALACPRVPSRDLAAPRVPASERGIVEGGARDHLLGGRLVRLAPTLGGRVSGGVSGRCPGPASPWRGTG